MPPKLVSEMTIGERENYEHWLNYCCQKGGCFVCDRLFCEGRPEYRNPNNSFNEEAERPEIVKEECYVSDEEMAEFSIDRGRERSGNARSRGEFTGSESGF